MGRRGTLPGRKKRRSRTAPVVYFRATPFDVSYGNAEVVLPKWKIFRSINRNGEFPVHRSLDEAMVYFAHLRGFLFSLRVSVIQELGLSIRGDLFNDVMFSKTVIENFDHVCKRLATESSLLDFKPPIAAPATSPLDQTEPG